MRLITRTRAVLVKRNVLWTLVIRDLRVRYSRSVLGYVWTVLDPLLMSLIYFVVFVYIFQRKALGHDPYFLFLVAGLLPWQWFSGVVSESSRALIQEAKLVRSTNQSGEVTGHHQRDGHPSSLVDPGLTDSTRAGSSPG